MAKLRQSTVEKLNIGGLYKNYAFFSSRESDMGLESTKISATAMGLSQVITAVLGATLLVAGCGGGANPSVQPPRATAPVEVISPPVSLPIENLPSSASLAQQCVAPRPGSTDKQGSVETEKSWVRSFMNETYLWYKDIPVVDASQFTLARYNGNVFDTLTAYFQALLTPTQTASGKRTDQFSFTIPTQELEDSQNGISLGYGITWAFVSNRIPRVVKVVEVVPASPAALAGVSRGDTLISVDGLDINDPSPDAPAKLNAGIFPTQLNKLTNFKFQSFGAATSRDVALKSAVISEKAVQLTKVVTDGDKRIGYLVLNSFNILAAESELISAINTLKAASVNELVLDLRYNGGGFLDISSELGWMIGGSTLDGKVFERSTCNDKNRLDICNTSTPFHKTTQGFSGGSGQSLPQLGLSRVLVLTTGNTCSASEALINSLTPFLQVVQIGSTTCGKPYGFFITDNCGTSYAAIQFQGVNALGFGEYADGFSPTCNVPDDLSKFRGDSSEAMFSGALGYIKTGTCPLGSGITRSLTAAADPAVFKIARKPWEEIRILSKPNR